SNIPGALDSIRSTPPDLILLDAGIAQQNGFDELKSVMHQMHIPVILLAEANGKELKMQAEATGAADYLVKNKINLFHLQKSIVSNIKVNKLQQSGPVDAGVADTLDKIPLPLLIIGHADAVLYASTQAYAILGEEEIRRQLSGVFVHKPKAPEQQLQVGLTGGGQIKVKVAPTTWKGKDASLFILEKLEAATPAVALFKPGELLATLLDSMAYNILLSKAGFVIAANRRALQAFGLELNDVVNRPVKVLFDSEGPIPAFATVASIFEGRQFNARCLLAAAAGQMAQISVKPIQLNGEIYELITFALTNTGKALPEQGVFTTDGILHLASHDLREPVRTILNYVQLITDNLQNKKYDAAVEYAGFAKGAANHMEKLLTDLKAFIGLNGRAVIINRVNMKQAVADVLKQLGGVVDEAGAEINTAELPEINGDRELIEMLLYQLMDNAIKFRKKGKKLVVDIGFDKYEGNILFCVRDNGIGISKKYHERVFELFSRLNRVDEYPGSGLGLALAKKIVELHNGKIWVESLPGFGSSFYFVLKP
ncbi:MAG TPA: ATP-binding protein, partial [Chitinophagales bacterium]|nr:ATP-binding protein [Chitinophagales bacterium]